MTDRFEGKTVVVTGGGQGIGRAIVGGFYREGARILVVDQHNETLTALSEEFEGIVVHMADLADAGAAGGVVPVALERLGSIDVLVNNAGSMPTTPILDIDLAQWNHTMAVNTRAPFITMQGAARAMVAAGKGVVVNVASANAFRAESPEADYNTSKAALVMLTRCFAHELGRHGLRFNCVAPGETLTAEEAAQMTPADVEAESLYLQRVPIGRPAHAREQANAVLFLASDESSFINGQTIIVDGGELTGDWLDPADRPPVSTDWSSGWSISP